MTRSPRYEFASPEWLAAIHGYLTAKTPEFARELDGASFSLCEVYTDVPAAIHAKGRVEVQWRFVDGELSFSESEADDVDLKVVADWETLAPLARIPSSGDPAAAARVQQAMADAVAGGKMSVTRGARRPPAFLAKVHDDMARLTK